MSITAGQVMDRSASLLNDTAKSIFTYTSQLPYLKTAYDELQEILELNNVPMTNEVSAIIPIAVGVTTIGAATGPQLPADLIDIQGCYERLSGSDEDFQEMDRVEFLPPLVELTESLIYWTWQDQIINFLGALTIRDVRLNYIGATLTPIVDDTSIIKLFNAMSFLAYRTAALCADFIGENETRSQELNGMAQSGLDRLLGTSAKGRQSIFTRRRPFMAAYKTRGYF